MKSIVVGTANDGAIRLLLGPEKSDKEQAEMMHAAKSLHRFPKGIKRVDMCLLTVTETAIHISDEVTKHVQAMADHTAAIRAKREEEEKSKLELTNKIKLAKESVRKAAVNQSIAAQKRNKLKGALNDANHYANTTGSKVHKEAQAKAQADYDLAEKEFAEADKALVEAKQQVITLTTKK